jgi:hypothetical protein
VSALSPFAIASATEVVVVALVVAVAVGFLLRRAIRTFAPRAGKGSCGCAGTPSCPATNAAEDLRSAARRAAERLASGGERTAR